MPIDFKNDLNEEQYQAATSDAQYLRIVAGAGTGKTRTLTYRLAYLISRGNIRPREIVAITFTNKAAGEMKNRTLKILSDNQMDAEGFPLIATFHSFCYRFLRRELVGHFKGFDKNFLIADETDQKSLFKKAGTALGMDLNSKGFKIAVQKIQDLKTEGTEWPEVQDFDHNNLSRMYNVDIKLLYKRYQECLLAADMVDFDDLLIFTRDIMQDDEACRRLYSGFYRSFLIDEFQDTNDLQYKIVKLFMNPSSELCVVGDPDQTIYTWRGADNHIIKDRLQSDFPSLATVTLDLNYRSTQKILDKANMLIRHNSNRVDKSLKSFSGTTGEDVDFVSSYEEKENAQTIGMKIKNLHNTKNIAYKDMAIIYRSNYLSRPLEETLAMMRIPTILLDATSFYERIEVKAGLSYLRLLINGSDSLSFENAIKYPTRKIGDKTLGDLYDLANANQAPLWGYIFLNADSLPVSETVKNNLVALVKACKTCQKSLAEASGSKAMAEAVDQYFEETGLFECVRKMDKDEALKRDADNENDREKNLQELVQGFKDYLDHPNESEEEEDGLTGFLINVSLITAQDQENGKEHDAVSLMTGHVSKGLEFRCVFVSGLVDGVFPSSHAYDSGREALEEERRLFYVAMTRAKEYLCITTYGGNRYGDVENIPSPFLKEIGFEARGDRAGFLYSSRHDSHSFSHAGRRENSAYGGNQMYRDIDRYAAAHGYDKEEDDYGADSSSYPEGYGIHKVSSVGVRPVGYSAAGANDVEYKPGDKVAHASFGVGSVIAVDGKKLTVDFGAPNGVKILIAGFKAFKKIS